MKKIYLSLIVVSALLVLGAGCSKTTDTQQPNSKPADNGTSTQTNTTNTNTQQNSEEYTGDTIFLTGKPGEQPGSVELEWKVPKDLESDEGYIIVRSEDPNPEQPTPYWYHMGKDHREKMWAGLPKGRAHFRVCNVKNDKCVEYSNDVEIEVK